LLIASVCGTAGNMLTGSRNEGNNANEERSDGPQKEVKIFHVAVRRYDFIVSAS
jgi:hypothetical protein